ncbi:MAG: NifB/NifX family molybdenum-iron cluster-binding protein [Bacillota bacterium]|nr:NifB/NifX family molybdenum-iron cluster-binding protein [Bacillota bacterium]
MLIGVAKEGNTVCQHFGHCESFAIYNTDTKEWKNVANPGHEPGVLPGFLADLGATVVISGGMGKMAQDLFNGKGIQVFVGAQGTVEEVMETYLKGELKSTGAIC